MNAKVYFLLSLIKIIYSFSNTQNSSEHLQQNSSIVEDNLIQREHEFRIIQSCHQYCDSCDQFGYCLKCQEMRVFPNCDCKIGFYNDNGKCLPCKKGCIKCTSQNDCQECQSIYTLNSQSQTCTCNISHIGDQCEDQEEDTLLYYSRLRQDLRGIDIYFNKMIALSGQDLSSITFPSQTNCNALDSTSRTIFGAYTLCFIDSVERNKFVVYLNIDHTRSGFLDETKFYDTPIFDISMIEVQINERRIKAKKIISIESKTYIQLNIINKICYFPQKTYTYNIGSGLAFTQMAYLDGNSETGIKKTQCNIVSPSQYTSISLDCSTKDISFFSNPNIEDTIVVQIECDFLSIKSTDYATIKISSTLPTSVGQFFYQVDSQNGASSKIPVSVTANFKSYPSLQDLVLNISFIPRILDDYIIQVDPQQPDYLLIIPPFTVKYSLDVFVLVFHLFLNYTFLPLSKTLKSILLQFYKNQFRVNDKQGVLISQGNLKFAYISFSRIQESNGEFGNHNPLSDLWIKVDTSNIILTESYSYDPKYHTQEWYCRDDQGKDCKSYDNSPLQIISYGDRLKVLKNQLPINKKFKFYYQIESKQYPNSKLLTSTNVNSGISYTYLQINGQKWDKDNPPLVNLQDILLVELFMHTDFSYQVGEANYYITITSMQNQQLTITSKSNKISFIVEDYFPLTDFSVDPTYVSLTYSLFDLTLKQTIPMKDLEPPNQVYLRIPPSAFTISIQQQSYTAFQDQITIKCTPINGQLKYQFFYYTSANIRTQELVIPNQTTRKMLSTMNYKQEVTTLLPPGDIIVMVVVLQENVQLYANITKTVVISDNKFNLQTYTTFIEDQYNIAQQFQLQLQYSNEIFIYQTIMEAIEQFEKTQQSSSVVNSKKINILQRLIDNIWNKQAQEIFYLSGEIIFRMIKSKVQINQQVQNDIKTFAENRINDQLQQISAIGAPYLTYTMKQQFKQGIRITIQTYMQILSLIGDWSVSSNEKAIQQSINSMQGLSQTLRINQSPINIETVGPSLQVERLDFRLFMDKYYSQFNIQPDPVQDSLNYYVLIQTWSENTHLYRNELQQINQEYFSKATTNQLNLISKTYPIRIPSILNDSLPGRRILAMNTATLPENFILDFGKVSQEEKLKCIQRSSSGKWVHSSCSIQQYIENKQRHINCVCKKPDLTSLIADVEAIFGNENVSKIFSEDGFLGIAKLDNWYEFAAIWTIIGLNIIFVLITIFGYRLDKRDSQVFIKKAFLQVKVQPLIGDQSKSSQIDKKKQSIFMLIKNKQIKEYNIINEISNQNQDYKEMSEQKLKEKGILVTEVAEIKENQFDKQSSKDLKIEDIENKQSYEPPKSQLIIESHKQFSQAENQELITQNMDTIQNDDQNQELNKQQSAKNKQQFQGGVYESQYKSNYSPANKEQHFIDLQQNQENINDNNNNSKQIDIKDNQQQISEQCIPDTNNTKIQKQEEKKKKQALKKLKEKVAKQKLEEYLKLQHSLLGILSFHHLISTFFIYHEKCSRILRFVIYYNKLVWLLTLNSIFGKDLSVVQVIVLSIITSIVLQIITMLVTVLLKKAKFRKFGLVVTSLFVLLCYYSILVVISGQTSYQANKWVASYFATFLINEFIIGLLISTFMYYACKKMIHKIQNNLFLEILGASVLLQTFSI